jgi:hypothetical protein
MPLTGIRLLFETLVQCTRVMCKCEMREIGSKDCNACRAIFREPYGIAVGFLRCIAKLMDRGAAMLDRRGRAP